MFINKAEDGTNNLCGRKITELRTGLGISQRILAEQLQLLGLDLGKNAISKIEIGKRFVTDVELVVFAQYFGVSIEELLGVEIKRARKK